MKNFFVNALIVLVSLSLALVLAEGAFRLLTPPPPVMDDPVLGNVMRPGGEYDARGWRNTTALPQATVVAIGDSQTQGNNAPTSAEAWPQTFGRLASTSVYQMALGGYGPVQYDELVDRALALNPKVVVVGLYFGNDLLDAERIVYERDHWKNLRDPSFAPVADVPGAIDYRTLLQTGLSPASMQFKIYQARLWVRAHSLLYAKIGDVTRSWRERIGVAKTKTEKLAKLDDYASEHPESVYTVKEPGIETVLSPGYRFETVALSGENTAEGWRIAQDRFRDIAAKLRAKNVQFVLLAIPTKEGAYLEHWRRVGKVPEVFTRYAAAESALAQATASFCTEEEIDCVFALPAMADALDRGEALYGKTFDGHPIPAGYRVIAEALLRAQVSSSATK